MHMIRSMRRGTLLSLAAGACLTAGCGPKVSQEELGKVVFKVPRVEGADERYPLPLLEGLPVEKEPPGGKLIGIKAPNP